MEAARAPRFRPALDLTYLSLPTSYWQTLARPWRRRLSRPAAPGAVVYRRRAALPDAGAWDGAGTRLGAGAAGQRLGPTEAS